MIKINNAVNDIGTILTKKLDNNKCKIKIKLSEIQNAVKSVEEKYNPASDEFVTK